MYLSVGQVSKAIKRLAVVKPFFGTAFLVFKAAELPVDLARYYPEFHSNLVEFFERYYRPDPTTRYYFHACRAPRQNQYWVEENYPTAGRSLDKTIRTTFQEAFIHPNKTHQWGWQPDYVAKLKSEVGLEGGIPGYYLAVWLYRERDWPENTQPEDIWQTFVTEFQITDEEQQELFDNIITPLASSLYPLLQPEKIAWNAIMQDLELPPPPDAPAEKGRTLVYLELKGIGPARQLALMPAERLNLITGDNGLGKTFLLETAWWALTGEWAGLPAYPRPDAKRQEPKITYHLMGESNKINQVSVPYSWETQWKTQRKRETTPGLLIYARVDGSFAVWDPLKQYGHPTEDKHAAASMRVFTREQLWEGLDDKTNGKTISVINGLLRDWVMWQNTPTRYPFEPFKQALKQLSPPRQSDLDILEPGKPIRLPGDSKEIPTLKHPYGEVPVVHAAAGVRRIITLAYLIIWAWNEHKIEAEISRRKPEKRLVILIDEIEAHLHPQWQRRILPALLTVGEALEPGLQIQFFVATHSPLVTASMEPKFEADLDKLFHLDIEGQDQPEQNAVLKEIPFDKYGSIDSWLMSDVFELLNARSLEAEEAIEEAKALQLQDKPHSQDVRIVSEKLKQYLATHDEFWPRWKYFAEQHGVEF